MQLKKFVVNLHLTYKCNMKCVFCHGTFSNAGNELNSLESWIKVVDNINDYCKNKSQRLRINLAGGEPLLVPFIDDLIDYIYLQRIELSIITNGFYLTDTFLERNHRKISMIGISIDSLSENSNKNTGRCHKNLYPITQEELNGIFL